MADIIMIGDCGPGKSFKWKNEIYTSLSIDHNKTAMRQMIVKIKAKNLRTGAINVMHSTVMIRLRPST